MRNAEARTALDVSEQREVLLLRFLLLVRRSNAVLVGLSSPAEESQLAAIGFGVVKRHIEEELADEEFVGMLVRVA